MSEQQPETFGHEPVTGTGLFATDPPACLRCTERRRDGRGRGVYRPAMWPCMSAVVLGLVPREEPTSTGYRLVRHADGSTAAGEGAQR